MSILGDTYIFYADIYFLQNFMMKLVVIYLSLYCNKFHRLVSTLNGMGKMICAAFLGTAAEVLGLLLGNSYYVFLLLIHILEIPFMMRLVFGKEYKQMMRTVVSGYFFVMVVNAVVEILWNWFGESGSFVFGIGVAGGMVYVGVRIWKNYTKIQKSIFPIEIIHAGKCVAAYGFYDSGNQLTDPYTGKGVHIISEKLFGQLQMETQKEVYIPYQSLGNEKGLIRVYYVGCIKVQKEQHFIEKTEVPVGVTEDTLFQSKGYQMILNAEIW